MKRTFFKNKFSALLLAILLAAKMLQAQEIFIIPKPMEVQMQQGQFVLDKNVSLQFDKQHADIARIAGFLNDYVELLYGYKLKENQPGGKFIRFKIINQPGVEDEAYQLKSDHDSIVITAAASKGLFYGVESLKQLLPVQSENNQAVIPAVEIKDQPRFSWRGNMLDVGRHFFPASFIKKYIDILAMYKINTFHWHLTDDQGWRIEIKRYPKLTKVGAWRNGTVIGYTGKNDGQVYGGYYTQDQVKDVVAYAKARYITIVPEIEMPGHSLAALSAYPKLGCTGGPYEVATGWGVHKDVYCAGKEKTFRFVENVLSEVIKLFSSEYIHIGGDECPKIRWKACPYDQARMKKEGLKNEEELQSYFIRRIEKFLNAHGKKLNGWDEILEGGLSPGATVMSWRGIKGGIAAAKQNHDVVMSPQSSMYLNFYQVKDTTGEPLSYRHFLPLETVYNYEPVPPELSAGEAKHILGVQTNLWAEYLPDTTTVEYMLLPRLQAEAEVGWSSKEDKDFDGFKKRLETDYERLKKQGINFRDHRK